MILQVVQKISLCSLNLITLKLYNINFLKRSRLMLSLFHFFWSSSGRSGRGTQGERWRGVASALSRHLSKVFLAGNQRVRLSDFLFLPTMEIMHCGLYYFKNGGHSNFAIGLLYDFFFYDTLWRISLCMNFAVFPLNWYDLDDVVWVKKAIRCSDID